MRLSSQRGFTLIEVVVAFAVFAVCIGALYESFAMALRRNEQAMERERALLTAQSLLSEQRVQPAPWPTERSGSSSSGEHWKMRIEPYRTDVDGTADHRASWHAYRVAVIVEPKSVASSAIELESIEVARDAE